MITPEEAQVLLQFALNFLASAGMSVRMMVERSEKLEAEEGPPDISTMN